MGAGESKLASSVEKGNIVGVREALKSGEDADCNNKGEYTPLHKAAEEGYEKIVDALIDARANVHAKDKRKQTLKYEPLHFASENGHESIVLLLLSAGASSSSRTASGDQPIHLAIKRNHFRIVAFLVAGGADLSTKDKSGKLPLQLVVEKGHLQMLQSLLNESIDLTVKDKDGNGVVHLASQNNHAHIMQALISAHADVSVKNASGQTPLHIAVENGNVNIVQSLVDAGVDISSKDKHGNQVQHLAASRGQTKIMDILLASGIDTKDFDPEGNQVIHLAAENGHHLIVSSLLLAGADLSIPNWKGNTAAHNAALHGFTEVLKVLKKHGDDFKAFSSNKLKNTPLHSATESGHMVTVQWLVRNGALLEAQNGSGCSPITLARLRFHEAISSWFDHVQEQRKNVLLYAKRGDFHSVLSALDVGATASRELLHRAVLAGKTRVVQSLVGRGTDLEQTSFFYRYRLIHYAAEQGHSQVVQELLKAGADHTAVDYKGRTAMHLAAMAGHERVLEVMKTFGCDIQIRSENRYKWTPLHYAASEGQLSTVKWLVRHDADVQAKDYQGNEPAKYASKKQKSDVIWWLTAGPKGLSNKENESNSAPLTSAGYDMQQEVIGKGNENPSKAAWSNQEIGDCEIPEICYNSVEGGCCKGEQEGCQRLHSNRHYHWQAKEPFGSWLNFPEKQVSSLERAFCNPGEDGVSLPPLNPDDCAFSPATLVEIIGKESWHVSFGDMTMTDSGNRRVIKLRRLCSGEFDGKPVKSSPFVWYFLDRNGKWVKYGNMDTAKEKDLVSNISSNEIEKHFSENPTKPVFFKNTKYHYHLDFVTMTQTNMETNACRDVRRRPQPHPVRQAEDNGKKRLQSEERRSDHPAHWEPMENTECLKRVKLSPTSAEYQTICNSLKGAVNSYCVEKIERIQNTFKWFAYQNKIQEMAATYGNDYEVNIRQLFHGTDASVIDKICHENFDWRLHGSSTGHLYGKGTYFSPDPKTAYAYCKRDMSGRYYLFIAQVAVGTYVVGNQAMVRPPTNPSTGKMYDSTVDSVFNPNIIVKYDKQEYYPEYIITINNISFTNGDSNCVIS